METQIILVLNYWKFVRPLYKGKFVRQTYKFCILILIVFTNNSFSQEFSARDLYKSCKSYKGWIESSFEEPVDSQLLFNMGKCQGIMETTGKMMLTLCKERKRNLNISKQLSANLNGVRTISLVKEYVREASKITNLQKYNAQELLSIILSKRWPCK